MLPPEAQRGAAVPRPNRAQEWASVIVQAHDRTCLPIKADETNAPVRRGERGYNHRKEKVDSRESRTNAAKQEHPAHCQTHKACMQMLSRFLALLGRQIGSYLGKHVHLPTGISAAPYIKAAAIHVAARVFILPQRTAAEEVH